MSPPSAVGSYQLPDLLSHFQDYHELSINGYCRAASLASEKWVLDIAQEKLGSPALSLLPFIDRLPSMKLGLLGACSFPSCDLTQLILMMDFCTLIVLDTEGLLRSNPPITSHWGLGNDTSNSGYVEVLQTHPVLQRLLTRLSRLQNSTTESWQRRFTSSIVAFRHSRQKAIDYRREGTALAHLEIEEYIGFRRDLSGIPFILDLMEAVEGLELDIPPCNDDLSTLRCLVGDIIVLTWDVFSYNIDQSIDNKINIVSLLQSKREIALVHSIKEAGDLIFQRIDAFKSLEKSLLSSMGASPSDRESDSGATALNSLWNNFTGLFSAAEKPNNPHPSVTDFQAHDIALYIRALKDCLVGFLHWAYETDIFFGTKGDTVKGFGWVFLLPPPNRHAETTA
ncbi:hypothetical protein C8J55DRAFT_485016 [Lentinula edodes]|uniref:Terpenoid synthase n=1 Tax=Lentinula lateritia TaxID=40482 RepID=A0A9W9B0E1_9AGAR|nr:hypothetical protein C8J55DRAFT_485016 [Lentinula edodes]